MLLVIDNLKLNAAVRSMHQFLPVARAIFPRPPCDDAVEAVTVFLYTGLAREIFGRRFARRLRLRLRALYKFAEPAEIERRVHRIESRLAAATSTLNSRRPRIPPHLRSAAHVTGIIRAILAEGRPEDDDRDIARMTYPRFENAVHRIKKHLHGIKQQPRFVMRS